MGLSIGEVGEKVMAAIAMRYFADTDSFSTFWANIAHESMKNTRPDLVRKMKAEGAYAEYIIREATSAFDRFVDMVEAGTNADSAKEIILDELVQTVTGGAE